MNTCVIEVGGQRGRILSRHPTDWEAQYGAGSHDWWDQDLNQNQVLDNQLTEPTRRFSSLTFLTSLLKTRKNPIQAHSSLGYQQASNQGKPYVKQVSLLKTLYFLLFYTFHSGCPLNPRPALLGLVLSLYLKGSLRSITLGLQAFLFLQYPNLKHFLMDNIELLVLSSG